MSKTNIEDLRIKIQKSMREHLESVSWQDGQDQKVFDELPNMWKKLETDGLMPEIKAMGMTFQHFMASAQQKYREIQIMKRVKADVEAFEKMFRRGK